ncbi:lipopolysaccharide assembly protein LapA domain-containing protein [Muricoccus radiodurans]|uniref:lipopolysaccharide assembly protein LapA domain-containing protein n=1 Tax=Muricoccus radiodurans TaxID=2231721 RepID=UPI003CF12B1E
MWRWLLITPLLLLLVLFALSNMQPVAVGLWPFDLTWQAPLAMVVLLAAALAFLLGALVAWWAGLPHRRRAWEAQRAAKRAEAELTELRAREAKRVEAETLARDRAMYAAPSDGRAVRVVG